MKSSHRALLFFAVLFGFIVLRGMAATFYPGVTPTSVPWPGGIVPYEFDTNIDLTPAQKEVYLDGMREWELAANVKFIPRTTENNYVILRFFYQKGTNTFQNFFNAPSVMTIDSLSRAQIGHETGHLLGFQHEHVRTNRDDYITVNFANLQTSDNGEGGNGVADLYVIDTNSTSYGPYDFESVMHYGRRLFALDPNVDVLAPLPPYVAHYYNRIGNLCISPLDRAGAAYLYGPPTTPLTNIVTTTADAGFGSLRAAIYYANDHPGTAISFNIPTTDPNYSNGVYSIYLTGELPPLVANGTVIDATTQPGYTGKPIVAIDGSRLLPETQGASGLHLYESSCTVRGLAIQHVTFSAIEMLYNFSQSNHVEGCYLGLAPDGTNAAPNGFQGVNIAGGSHGNVIGGTNASRRNVISGNIFSYGITITETNSDNNAVLGNYLGLDASGTFMVTNGYSGVGIWGGAKNTTVGGTNAGAGNVISGNEQYGVFIGDPDTIGTIVQGNFIGTDANGSNGVPNGIGGIAVFNGAHDVTIGGSHPAARNIISGNGTVGVYLLSSGASNNVVQGNYVGLDVSGSNAVPNLFAGIYLLGGAQNNLIGGTNAGEGNVISGNFSEGIYIADPGTSSNMIFGNRIGTDAQGVNPVPNGFTGVGVWNTANNNFIGGTNAGEGNLISGNSGNGVSMGDTNTTGNVVQGNWIGTTTNGVGAFPNASWGVFIVNGASGNLIGGNSLAARNVISGNLLDGVLISDSGTGGNQILGNYIGVDVTGTKALPNAESGISIVSGAVANQIGTPDPATRNIISGNMGDGVFIAGTNTDFNVVQGNYIGTDTSGVTAISNLIEGVVIIQAAQSNQIGGNIVGAGNVISASGAHGVFIGDTNTIGNWVAGNDIGVGANGLTRLGNALEGVAIMNGASSNLIGLGPNIISGNGTRGVWMGGPGTVGNVVEGNYIGLSADGMTAVGNLMEGVVIVQGAQGNVVGVNASSTAGGGNVIMNNGLEGVAIYDADTTGNTIRLNSMLNNGKPGLNLVGGTEDAFGITANDPGDTDTGPNNLQNYPVITSASFAAIGGGVLDVAGTLNSTPNRSFVVDLYDNLSADPSGSPAQGGISIGTVSLTTDASGNGSFHFFDSGTFAIQRIVVMATDITTGDSSEFSPTVIATNRPAVVTIAGPFTRDTNGFGFQVALEPYAPYRIQATTNLAVSNAWVNVTNVFPTNTTIQFVDPTATNFVRRFYRVVSP